MKRMKVHIPVRLSYFKCKTINTFFSPIETANFIEMYTTS